MATIACSKDYSIVVPAPVAACPVFQSNIASADRLFAAVRALSPNVLYPELMVLSCTNAVNFLRTSDNTVVGSGVLVGNSYESAYASVEQKIAVACTDANIYVFDADTLNFLTLLAGHPNAAPVRYAANDIYTFTSVFVPPFGPTNAYIQRYSAVDYSSGASDQGLIEDVTVESVLGFCPNPDALTVLVTSYVAATLDFKIRIFDMTDLSILPITQTLTFPIYQGVSARVFYNTTAGRVWAVVSKPILAPPTPPPNIELYLAEINPTTGLITSETLLVTSGNTAQNFNYFPDANMFSVDWELGGVLQVSYFNATTKALICTFANAASNACDTNAAGTVLYWPDVYNAPFKTLQTYTL